MGLGVGDVLTFLQELLSAGSFLNVDKYSPEPWEAASVVFVSWVTQV